MPHGLTYPEARALLYDKVGLTTAHPRLTIAKAHALIHRASLDLVREAVKVGAYPVQLYNRKRENLLGQEAQYGPTNMWAPLSVRVQDSSGNWSLLKKYTLTRFQELQPDYADSSGSNSGTPTVYYEMGVNTSATYWGRRQFGVWQVPESQIANGLEWGFIRAPLQYSDFANTTLQIVDFPGQYHDAIVSRAAWLFSMNATETPRGDFDKWGEQFAAEAADYAAECAEQNQMDLEEEFAAQVFHDRDQHWSGF